MYAKHLLPNEQTYRDRFAAAPAARRALVLEDCFLRSPWNETRALCA